MRVISYLFWLILVILWNYIFPEASSLADIVAAVVIGGLSYLFPLLILRKKK